VLNVEPLRALAEGWEAEAKNFRHRGLEGEARMAESFAADLRARLAAWEAEPLTVAEASEESGYSESHLRTLLSEGRLANIGRQGSPRIRRADLPAKPQADGPTLEVQGGRPSLAERALDRRRQ